MESVRKAWQSWKFMFLRVELDIGVHRFSKNCFDFCPLAFTLHWGRWAGAIMHNSNSGGGVVVALPRCFHHSQRQKNRSSHSHLELIAKC